MVNITSMSDIQKKKDDEKKRNELFNGGINQQSGGGSGLAVEGPPRSSSSNIFDSIVQRASNKEENDTSGGGIEHGNDNCRRITMYNNGFIVDNGQLRDLVSPENVAFLNSLQKGEVPLEFLREQLPSATQGGRMQTPQINIHLIDERPKDYIPPPPPSYTAFSGGSTLGSLTTSTSASTNAYRFSPTALLELEIIAIDDLQPTTTVQVRCANGKKLKIKINQQTSVLQLAAIILRDSDDKSGKDFILSSGFPQKDLTSENISISEAGLLAAAITQKMV